MKWCEHTQGCDWHTLDWGGGEVVSGAVKFLASYGFGGGKRVLRYQYTRP